MPPPAPPPLTKLERMVLEGVEYDPSADFDEQCQRVRRWLRAEVDRRLREVAKKETVEVVCGTCGEVTDVSQGHALKVAAGSVPPPECYECKRPERNAEAEVAAAEFVAAVEDQAELAGAVASLR